MAYKFDTPGGRIRVERNRKTLTPYGGLVAFASFLSRTIQAAQCPTVPRLAKARWSLNIMAALYSVTNAFKNAVKDSRN